MVSCTSIVTSFGKLPEGERLKHVKASQNYRDGEFKYMEPTPLWTGGGSTAYLKETLFGKSKQTNPTEPLPIVNTDLTLLNRDEDLVIWLGHSSFFIQMNGKRILIDPVFSSYLSPVPFLSKAFKGEYPYSAKSMPAIDYVIISHDHWDHLDYPTMTGLKNKVRKVITPLGVGSHLEKWGYRQDQIHEADWNDTVEFLDGIKIHVLPARHFSGRGLITSNQTLWASFLIESPNFKVYYSGDTGYGPHFADIGKRFEGIDIALMENGQYDPHWAHVHMLPEEAVQAAVDLNVKYLMPAHSGRFALGSHAWDDPYQRIAKASQQAHFTLLTPKMGQSWHLNQDAQSFSEWWKAR